MARARKNANSQPLITAQRLSSIVKSCRDIVAYLGNLQTKVDALKELQAETAVELDAMLPSIIDKAFKGAI